MGRFQERWFSRDKLLGAIGPIWLISFLNGVASAALVINEFLPDPTGSDAGREFVEILNTGDEPVPLEAVSLQFANGAEEENWQTRWTGSPAEVLSAGERYLIVDRNWQGEAAFQAEVALGLQNGPDAVRLTAGGAVLDLVGYGPLTDVRLMEDAPTLVIVGSSLARRPDGRDTDCNAADFVAAEPSPGSANFLPYSLTVAAFELEPPSLDRPGREVRLTVQLLNDGWRDLSVGTLLLEAGNWTGTALLDACPSGQSRTLSWQWRPSATGRIALAVALLPPAAPDTVRRFLGVLQVGPGPLVLNEVLPAPQEDQGEWIELLATDAEVDLGDYRLKDMDGEWRPLPHLALSRGQLAVVAQDSQALETWRFARRTDGGPWPCEDRTPVPYRTLSGSWPSLNNTPPPDRAFADRISLADTLDVVVDHVDWGRADDTGDPLPLPGRSLERIAGFPGNPDAANWAGCTARISGTPGCPNSVAVGATIPGPVPVIEPRILDPLGGDSTVHIRFVLELPAEGWEATIYNLWGRVVRDLGGDGLGTGPRDLLWDGRDDLGVPVPAGGYVVVLGGLDGHGRLLQRRKTLLAVRRSGS